MHVCRNDVGPYSIECARRSWYVLAQKLMPLGLARVIATVQMSTEFVAARASPRD